MDSHYDVLIMGGGIIGQSISYHLNKAGVKAGVIDKNKSGQQATRAAAGMLGVHTENREDDTFYQFCRRSRNLYSGLSKELRELTGIDIGLTSFGMLEIAANQEEKHELLQKNKTFQNLKWLNGPQLRERIPSLSKEACGALYMGEDGHVEPKNVCEAFKRGALLYGGELIENNTVRKIKQSAGGYQVQLEDVILTADKVVAATGAESGKWFEFTGLQNPIVPTKGECFSIQPTTTYFKESLFFNNFYLVPKPDGRCIIGATSKPYDQCTTTTAGGLSGLMNQVFSIVPDLKNEPFLDFWSGVRPGSLDGRPIIGEHPNLSGFLFATGHYRNGILLAPVTGQLVKDLIVNQTVDSSIQDLLSPIRIQTSGGSKYEYSSEWQTC
ncbi:glycine oxidase ThiO [Halobacillus rhizosphaerae]|uniref:glycine oxidase ThiO n=1 Tax=Halobacillus rhizosphaerae TaxID=3064889 RepID=UPI00398B93F9